MGNGCDGFKVRNIDGRIAEAFKINGLGLVVDVFGKGLRIIGIGKVRRNAEMFECFRKEFDRAAVQVGAAMISSPAPARLMME